MRFWVENIVEGTEGRAKLESVPIEREARFISDQIQSNHLFMPEVETRPHRLYDLATLEDGEPVSIVATRGVKLSNGNVYDVHMRTESHRDYPVQKWYIRAGLVRSSMRPLLAALLARDSSTLIVCDNANAKVWERLAREKVTRRGQVKIIRSAINLPTPVEVAHITIMTHSAARRITDLQPFDRMIVCDPLSVTTWPQCLRSIKWTWIMSDWADVRRQPVHALAMLKILHINCDDPHVLCQVQRLCCGALHTPRLAPMHHVAVPCECTFLNLTALNRRTIIGEHRDMVSRDYMGLVARDRREAVREALFESHESCNICLTEQADCTTNCGHVFCSQCVSRVQGGACPVCRQQNFTVLFTQPSEPPSKIQWLLSRIQPGGRTLVLADREFVHTVHAKLRGAVPEAELAKMIGVGRIRAGRIMAFNDAFTVVSQLNDTAEPDVSRVRTCLMMHVPTPTEYKRWMSLLHDSVNIVAFSLGSAEQLIVSDLQT